jgi:hypothetical protein
MRRQWIATGRGRSYPERGPTFYGMGFYLSTYRGHALVYHPGVIDGFAAMISFLPDDGMGVVVLSNLSGSNPAPSIVSYAVYDRLLGLAPLPWIERLRARREARAARASRKAPAKAPSTAPPRPALSYTGDYSHPAYGRLAIRAASDTTLSGTLHGTRFTLIHRGGDIWQVAETAWPLRAGLRVSFAFDGGARATRLATPLADGPTYRLQAGDMVFTRIRP